jgi:filamentous hemagglutinin
MNTMYHETENFERHNANEQTAINRGNTADAIWELKNFGNANTNRISSEKWNETNAGSSLYKTGNQNAITNIVSDKLGIGTMNAYGGNVNVSGATGKIIDGIISSIKQAAETEAQSGYPTFRKEGKEIATTGAIFARDILTSYPLYEAGSLLIEDGSIIKGVGIIAIGGILDATTVAPIIGEGAAAGKTALKNIIKKEVAQAIESQAIKTTAGKAVTNVFAKSESKSLMIRTDLLNNGASTMPRLTDAEVEQYAIQSTINPNSNKLILGKYIDDINPASYQNVAKQMEATYFQLPDKLPFNSLYPGDAWRINAAFERQQLSNAEKSIFTTHTPHNQSGGFKKEIGLARDEFAIIEYGKTDNGLWKTIQ